MSLDETTRARLQQLVADHPYPRIFVTLSGAHLYGFPSPDSDFDLRGVHLLPAAEVVGIETGPETVESMEDRDGLELDLVTHDLAKFARLLLRPNGYVLEQLTSPLVVETGPVHEQLLDLVPQLVTRHHAHHYRGFAGNQWKLFASEDRPRVKPLLYVLRVLLTGIHLMRTGEVEADLGRLAPGSGVHELPELLAAKREGPEKGTLEAGAAERYRPLFERLQVQLDEAAAASRLPEKPTARAALHQLLVSRRLATA